jgi:hypothetical protein
LPLRAHFTISSNHRAAWQEALAAVAAALPPSAVPAVTFSEQSPATDTLAADQHGELLRDELGRLELRPGGHGALLRNLESAARDHGFDLVWIKNIDNVRPPGARTTTVAESRALFGLLLVLERQVAEHLTALESSAEPAALRAAAQFLARELARPSAPRLLERPAGEARLALRGLLERPLRVCGVVPNSGEPGGGPFWVADREFGQSPQIVEVAQILRDDPAQAAILAGSTHFNPVALFCSLRSSRGEPFSLARYVDPETWFVATKSKGGRQVRALERPGLWNGAMAGWNTVFVHMSPPTFAPVKTVFDLLRPEHQAST